MPKMKRLIALVLAMLLLMPAFSFAKETGEEAPITHTAKATVALKVRRAPADDAAGCDSISRHSFVYILEYGDTWC